MVATLQPSSNAKKVKENDSLKNRFFKIPPLLIANKSHFIKCLQYVNFIFFPIQKLRVLQNLYVLQEKRNAYNTPVPF